MAGYNRPRKTYLLRFAEGDMAGLEVTMRGVSINALLSLLRLGSEATGSSLSTEEKAEKIDELFRVFAGKLVSWNLEDDSGPVPATWESVESYTDDPMFVIAIINAWTDAMASVDIPLPPSSNGGQPSAPALSMPMEPLSPSPPS